MYGGGVAIEKRGGGGLMIGGEATPSYHCTDEKKMTMSVICNYNNCVCDGQDKTKINAVPIVITV